MTPQQAWDIAIELGTRHAAALAVNCPVCWAAPGIQCEPTLLGQNHSARLDKARRRGILQLIDSS